MLQTISSKQKAKKSDLKYIYTHTRYSAAADSQSQKNQGKETYREKSSFEILCIEPDKK